MFLVSISLQLVSIASFFLPKNMITLFLFSSHFQYLRTVVLSPLQLSCHFITEKTPSMIKLTVPVPCISLCLPVLRLPPNFFQLSFFSLLELTMEDFFSIPQSIPTQQSPRHALLSGISWSSFNCHISGTCMVHLWHFTSTSPNMDCQTQPKNPGSCPQACRLE